jgi:hypothetical protein
MQALSAVVVYCIIFINLGNALDLRGLEGSNYLQPAHPLQHITIFIKAHGPLELTSLERAAISAQHVIKVLNLMSLLAAMEEESGMKARYLLEMVCLKTQSLCKVINTNNTNLIFSQLNSPYGTLYNVKNFKKHLKSMLHYNS